MRSLAVAAIFSLASVGCSSAGPYGYSRDYSPLSAEEDAVEGAREYDPVMVQRDPDDWKKGKVMLFGVVRSRTEGPGGTAYLSLGMRSLAARNLCDDFEEETCRVTVGNKEHAIVHVLAKLGAGDDIGKESIGAGSLVRVVGKLADGVDPEDGTPVLEVQYYRHWPRGFYVTSADASHMRK
jgi:hypothetical protein